MNNNQPIAISNETHIFTLDSFKGFFEGYGSVGSWNGFSDPLFTKEIVEHLIDSINNKSTGKVLYKAFYDYVNDAFILYCSEDGVIEVYKGRDYLVNGETLHLYAIGDGWCWYVATDCIEVTDEPVFCISKMYKTTITITEMNIEGETSEKGFSSSIITNEPATNDQIDALIQRLVSNANLVSRVICVEKDVEFGGEYFDHDETSAEILSDNTIIYVF